MMKCMKVHGAKGRNTVTFLEGKHVENTGGYKDMGTKRQDIRTLSKRHPGTMSRKRTPKIDKF